MPRSRSKTPAQNTGPSFGRDRAQEPGRRCYSHNLNIPSCFVKVGPSMLTPFLHSDAQGAIMAETLLDAAAELTIAEIGRRAGVLPAVAHREVPRLIDADVLRDRREGNNRLVRANTGHPLWPLMSQIVTETYGPVPVLHNLLAEVPGIRQAYIYGSWAARRAAPRHRCPGHRPPAQDRPPRRR